jgi:hypothetical protein
MKCLRGTSDAVAGSVADALSVVTFPDVMWRRAMLTLIAIAVAVLIAFGMFVWLQDRREA